ncbi:hypothetical protein ACFP2T_16460 [Plantactinospora solaniradicis]|uniref:Head-to-tail adaptor n=1 Tax=Plantactinospora solaniradicis TaxID=1723736 RepID=A0ABW1K8J2_9ACTN
MAENLFDTADLPGWLSGSNAELARRAANGWLQDATGLTTWPDPVPDRLWAWAIELAAIAMRSPDGAGSESIDDYQVSSGGSGDWSRRAEILAAARAAYNTGSGQPVYSFPEPDWSWRATGPRYL